MPVHHLPEVLDEQLHQFGLDIRDGDRVRSVAERSGGVEGWYLPVVEPVLESFDPGVEILPGDGRSDPVFERIVADWRTGTRLHYEETGYAVPLTSVPKVYLCRPSDEHDIAGCAPHSTRLPVDAKRWSLSLPADGVLVSAEHA
jgi:hypothetical protein